MANFNKEAGKGAAQNPQATSITHEAVNGSMPSVGTEGDIRHSLGTPSVQAIGNRLNNIGSTLKRILGNIDLAGKGADRFLGQN